jgi:tetratricopeptide (TPR) repeat protein
LATIMDGGNPQSYATMKRAIELMEATVRGTPDDPGLRAILSGVHTRAGSMHVLAGHTPERVAEAVGHARRSRELAHELSTAFPDDAHKLARLQETATNLAEALVRAGEYREGDVVIAEAVAINKRLIARDPKDHTVIFDQMKALAVSADIAGRLGDSSRAVRLGREALAIATRLPPEVQQSRDVQARSALAKVFMGHALLASAGSGNPGSDVRLARLREARGLLAEGVAFIARMRKEGLGTVPEDIETRLLQALKQCNEAIAKLEAA